MFLWNITGDKQTEAVMKVEWRVSGGEGGDEGGRPTGHPVSTEEDGWRFLSCLFILLSSWTDILTRVHLEFHLKVIFLIKSQLPLQVKPNRGKLKSEGCTPKTLNKNEKYKQWIMKSKLSSTKKENTVSIAVSQTQGKSSHFKCQTKWDRHVVRYVLWKLKTALTKKGILQKGYVSNWQQHLVVSNKVIEQLLPHLVWPRTRWTVQNFSYKHIKVLCSNKKIKKSKSQKI